MIVRCLHYMGTYDQLNLPCLASAEVLSQRLAQLIEAYAGGDRSSPNYKAVKHFTPETTAAQIVPAALRSYAHRKSKEEHDMEALRSRATGAVGKGTDDADGDGEAAAPLGRRARQAALKAGKGGGRGGKLTAADAK